MRTLIKLTTISIGLFQTLSFGDGPTTRSTDPIPEIPPAPAHVRLLVPFTVRLPDCNTELVGLMPVPLARMMSGLTAVRLP